MPTTWNLLITALSDITRKKCDALVCCPHCGNLHVYIKWGYYNRYLFDDEIIKIQRYRCDNESCPQKTFSILPHAFLPIIRASLCMLMYILRMYEQGENIAVIARHTGNTWTRIKRWIEKAISVRDWLRKECKHEAPCWLKIDQWTCFIRNFSWAFYPDRMR